MSTGEVNQAEIPETAGSQPEHLAGNRNQHVPPKAGGPEEYTPKKISAHWVLIVVLVAVFVLGAVVYSGIHARAAAEGDLAQRTEQAAIPAVNVVFPKANSSAEEIVLPGNTQAFNDTPIYARTNGYLKRWYVDIGTRVKQGQLLAEIETPEVDQQLLQARADLKTSQANVELARITAARWVNLLKTNSVSKQETDQAVSDQNAKEAAYESSLANVRRLEQLQSFEKVYAPFDGVITARNTDIGALIDAGANTTPKELFHLAAVNKLRVFVAVPEIYSEAAENGAKATLTLDEYPNRSFEGTMVRNANAIDLASRTLNVEVDVDNTKGLIRPGAYAFVHIKMPNAPSSGLQSVTVPANTLLFRSEGLRVGVVHDGHAELVPIKIGRDYGSTVEVIAGLHPTDAVIVNPSDSLINGTPVKVSQQAGGGK
jgi:RND family efflux transporter MFP subunit